MCAPNLGFRRFAQLGRKRFHACLVPTPSIAPAPETSPTRRPDLDPFLSLRPSGTFEKPAF
ncbi:hypothetical protein LZ32DRAFT_611098 [Colletotrichum eremochloae]|nr:hypothetical protein LZ32DRAFT_611098 [Colletotrichum eremochloae]